MCMEINVATRGVILVDPKQNTSPMKKVWRPNMVITLRPKYYLNMVNHRP